MILMILIEIQNETPMILNEILTNPSETLMTQIDILMTLMNPSETLMNPSETLTTLNKIQNDNLNVHHPNKEKNNNIKTVHR